MGDAAPTLSPGPRTLIIKGNSLQVFVIIINASIHLSVHPFCSVGAPRALFMTNSGTELQPRLWELAFKFCGSVGLPPSSHYHRIWAEDTWVTLESQSCPTLTPCQQMKGSDHEGQGGHAEAVTVPVHGCHMSYGLWSQEFVFLCACVPCYGKGIEHSGFRLTSVYSANALVVDRGL